MFCPALKTPSKLNAVRPPYFAEHNTTASAPRHIILRYLTWKVAITKGMMSTHPPACDRCHALKMKCVYQDIHSRLACSRCWRMAQPCTSTRKTLAVGRPRKKTTSTQPKPNTEFVWTYSQRQRGTTTSFASTGAHLENPRPISDGSKCRLTQECATPLTIRPRNFLLSGIKPSERLLLELIFYTPTFIHHFILSPSFADNILTQLFARVCSAPDVLRDIFLANAGQFARMIGLHLMNNDSNEEFSNSARAVQVLRAAEMHALQKEADLINFLTLGLGIITFDLFTSGLHAHLVSRFTVGLVEHLYPRYPLDTHQQRLISHAHLDLHLTPLLFCDVINCIVKRGVPVLKFQYQTVQPVDRYIGLCSELLPHLFDICFVSHELNASEMPDEKHASVASNVDLKKELDRVEQAVESWVPLAPDDFTASHPPQDVKVIETQAEIYKYAALLIIHRLRFRLGRHDDAAKSLSHLIFTNIKKLQHLASNGPTDHSRRDDIIGYAKSDMAFEYRLNFPYLVASLEVEGLEARSEVINILPVVVSPKRYPHVNHMLEQFLHYYWSARDENPHRQFFDLISRGPVFVLF